MSGRNHSDWTTTSPESSDERWPSATDRRAPEEPAVGRRTRRSPTALPATRDLHVELTLVVGDVVIVDAEKQLAGSGHRDRRRDVADGKRATVELKGS